MGGYSDVPTTFSPNVTPLEVFHTFGVTAGSPTNTQRENYWTTTSDSSWGNDSTTSYTDRRSIFHARPKPRSWNRRRPTSCLLSTSLGNLIRFLIILGLRRLSLFICLKGSRGTSTTLPILKYPLPLPTPLPRTDPGRQVRPIAAGCRGAEPATQPPSGTKRRVYNDSGSSSNHLLSALPF